MVFKFGRIHGSWVFIVALVSVTAGGLVAAQPASAITCAKFATTQDDNYATPMGKAFTVAAPGLMANDVGDAILVEVSWGAGNLNPDPSDDASYYGNAAIDYGVATNHRDRNGGFTYTPDPGTPFTGVDEFEYWTINACGDTDWGTAYITVKPTIVAMSYAAPLNTHIVVPKATGFLSKDKGVDPISMFFDDHSAHGGTITDGNASDGSFTYTPAHNFFGVDTFTYQIDDLNGDITYTSTVHVAVGVKPAAPTSVSAVAGNASATVRWKAPTNHGSGPITGYVVTPYVNGVAQKARSYGTATAEVVTGLANAKSYTFRVAAKNAVGIGATAIAAANAGGSAALTVGAPTAPGHVTAAAGKGRAIVHWIAPANNGAAITSYAVIPYVGAVALPGRGFASAATTVVFVGLVKGRTYRFRVAARNARGTGQISAFSNAVVPS